MAKSSSSSSSDCRKKKKGKCCKIITVNKKCIGKTGPTGPIGGGSGPTGSQGSTGSQGPTGQSPGVINVLVELQTPQSIPNSTNTAIVWDSEIYDVGGMFNPLFPTRITFPVNGKYIVGTTVSWNEGITGGTITTLEIRFNGASSINLIHGFVITPVTSFEQLLVDTNIYIATDFVEILVSQNSGSSQNIGPFGGKTVVWAQKID